MKKIIEYLERLDFSEQEAKLYLILLRTGSMTVAELAQKANINRTATYTYINNLLKKGVIVQAKGATSKITANPPAQLHYLVDQKISSANVLKEDLSPIVTMLNATFMQTKTANESEIHYYKGRNSVKAIYEDVLKADVIRSYFNCHDIKRVYPENFALFDKTFDKNPQILMYEIIEYTPTLKDSINYYARRDRYFFKFLPKDIKLTSNDILIYNGKVAIVNIGDADSVTGVVLENQDYYNNSVQLFDLLWRLLPDRRTS